MINVLYVASECKPFIKTTEAGEAVSCLPQHLKLEEQMEIRVILPLYDEIPEKWKSKMVFKKCFRVSTGIQEQEACLYTLVENDVHYYFIANDYYFGSLSVFDYLAAEERYVFFCTAVIYVLPYLDFSPHILHAHDWQAGLTIPLQKLLKPKLNMKTVFTIYNLKHQGTLPIERFQYLFSPPLNIGLVKWDGKINSVKSALLLSDSITVISPNYAKEIQTTSFGEGLHSILQQRKKDIIGVLHGIDTKDYNPSKDPNISINYQESLFNKHTNKMNLQAQLALPVSKSTPLYIMITKLIPEKGMDLLEQIIDRFLYEDVQFTILGTGDNDYEDFIYEAGKRHPDKFVPILSHDERIARQLYAAADFLVMPSQYEPCGYSPLIALQYKTVPIVRETGGLSDIVQPYDQLRGIGNGLSFRNYHPNDLFNVLRNSMTLYHDKKNWRKLFGNTKRDVHSWKDTSKEYAKLYNRLLNESSKRPSTFASA